MLTGRKAPESVGKFQPLLGCKAGCCGFLEESDLSSKLSESISSQKEGTEERRQGRKEHTTVHTRQYPPLYGCSNVRSKEVA